MKNSKDVDTLLIELSDKPIIPNPFLIMRLTPDRTLKTRSPLRSSGSPHFPIGT